MAQVDSENSIAASASGAATIREADVAAPQRPRSGRRRPARPAGAEILPFRAKTPAGGNKPLLAPRFDPLIDADNWLLTEGVDYQRLSLQVGIMLGIVSRGSGELSQMAGAIGTAAAPFRCFDLLADLHAEAEQLRGLAGMFDEAVNRLASVAATAN